MATKKDLKTSDSKKVGRPRKKVEPKTEPKIAIIDDLEDLDEKDDNSGKVYTVSTKSFLNIREGAGRNYGIVGRLEDGDKVTIREISEGYGMIEPKKWICMEFLK